MTVPSVGSSSSSSSSSSAAASNSLGLTQNDFMQLLVTQMQNQNPLDPVDSTDFITQLAQFSQVSSMNTLNSNISQMLTMQQMSQASGLIGKTIAFVPSGSSTPSSGVVSSVQITNGTVNVMVGTQSVPLTNITSIQRTSGTTS